MSQSKSKLLQNARMLLAAHEELKEHFYGMMQVMYAIAARSAEPLTVSEFELDNLPADGKIRIHHDVDTSLFTIIPFRPEDEKNTPGEVVEAEYEKHPLEEIAETGYGGDIASPWPAMDARSDEEATKE